MIMGVSQFERLFREAASLDVDKSDLKRLSDFMNRKVHDLLLLGQVAARANGRDVIQLYDLPITKGLQESIHAFRKLDGALARTFKILDPKLKNPQSEHWGRAEAIFDLLL